MKDILIIANYIVAPNETGNGRFNYIAKKLSNEFNCQVELVSSIFSHCEKNRRKDNLNFKNYKLTLLEEPGYKKNISLKRFYSHWILSKNLKQYLKKREKPDIIYCAIPSLSLGKVAIEYAKKNNIKFVLDIQDLWPEAFRMVFNPKIIGDLIYYPLKKQADYIYKNADEIIAVSETYVTRGLKINKKQAKGHSVFLGNDLEEYDSLKNKIIIEKPKNKFWITYVGTLGHSYDIKIIIDALEIINRKIKNIEFLILGDGPLKEEFERYGNEKEVKMKFLGRVPFEFVVNYLDRSDILVNPIKSGSAASIINKVGDYASAGRPVINTQECKEYRTLVEIYEIGFNCKNSDSKDIADKIYKLYLSEELRIKMGKNNRKLAEEKFDRKKTYKKIMDVIIGKNIKGEK